jgi:nucleoporin SEH1
MASFGVQTSHQGFVKDIQFDHYGRRFATCSADEKPRIEVFDQAEDGVWSSEQSSKQWSAHEQTINKLSWAHPRFGQVLASCSDDTSAEIWEEQDTLSGVDPKWHGRAKLSDAKKPIKDVAFAPAHLGLKLALACMDGKVYVYEALDVMNLSDWTLEEAFEAFEPKRGDMAKRAPGVRCLSWNPSKFDPPMLVVGAEGDDDGTAAVRLFQYPEATRRWSPVCALEPHQRPDTGCSVNDVAWAPNMGRSFHLIASAGQDQTNQLKIHRLRRDASGLVYEGTQAFTVLSPQGVWRCQWNATGTVLASSGEEGAVHFWKSNFRGEWGQVRALEGEGTEGGSGGEMHAGA